MSSSKAARFSKTKVVTLVPSEAPQSARLPELTLATVVGFDAEGAPLIEDHHARLGAIPRPALALGGGLEHAVGRQVAVMLADGDPARPVILGLVAAPVPSTDTGIPANVVVDGERVIIAAEREVVIQCGEASITLTRAGKVLIRGTYLSSRSTGANRIRGGSVELN